MDYPPLIRAVMQPDLPELGRLLNAGAYVDVRDPRLATALHWASDQGDWASAFTLLAHHAEVDLRDGDGWTPLHVAAHKGHVDIIILLLQWNPDVSAKVDVAPINFGYTPLHFAAKYGHVEAVQTLIDRGADVMSVAADGGTPEGVATAHGHLHIAAIINAAGVQRDRFMAFAMGHHQRLGQGSSVMPVEPEMMRLILSHLRN
jgi:ankyrin repeat protein